MPNEIYHRSNWGNANAEGFGDVYFDAAATNKLYNHSDYYENSNGTDKILRDLSNKASVVLTPTAYSDGSLNTVIPPYQVLPQELVTNGDFSDATSNWASSNSTLSIEDDYLKITSTGGNRPQANQNVSGLTIGKKYKLSAEAKKGTCSQAVEIEISGINATVDTNKNNTTEFKNIFYDFIATSTIHTIQAKIDDGSSTVGETAFFKIISLKEIQEADFDFSRGSSATRVNEKGLIESIASGLPRIDYTSGFGSLLLEPQRTNLVDYSDFSSGWSLLSGGSVAYDQTISPDGTQNAPVLSGDGVNSNSIYDSVSLSVETYTFSVFAKQKDVSIISLNGFSGGAAGTSKFNLSNGTIDTASGGQFSDEKIEDYGNGWYRCSVKVTATSSGSKLFGFGGENSDSGELFSLYGAQLEEGSYATSYIVSNSGSATTRSADVANNSGNADLFNDSEGVLYAEVEFVDDATSKLISINDNSSSNRILFGNFSDGNFKVYSQSSDLIVVSGLTGNNKIAAKYKSGDFSLFVNGVEIGTSTSTVLPTGLSELSFDNGSGGSIFYGKTKELAVFKEALTDAELESLTSWVSFTEMATDLEYTLE